MESKSKSKTKVLTFAEKEKIIEKLKLGYSVEKLAIDFKVSERTIYRINRQSDNLDQEIVDYVNNQEIEDESEEQLITGPRAISSTAAITQCENIITYFKSNNIRVDLSPILKTLKEHAAIKQFNAKSQTSIKDFFSTSQTVTSEKKIQL